MKLHILYYKISFYVCTNNDTRIETFVIEKKSSFLLVLDHLGCGFYEFQHVYSMHATPIEIIDFFENLNSDCISFNFYARNKRIYGTGNYFKSSIHKK
jgi:hypothetical protein